MKDNKNLILAVVLSALVLLGWTWAANKYFPTANPPSTKVVNGKQQPLPQPQAQAMFADEIGKWGRMVKTLGLSVK